MRRFILSDLHIGHEDSQYDVMDQAISYVRQKAGAGDHILGLGDWFHMNQKGFDFCIRHPMTPKFRDLAGYIPTRLIPGNHDHHLARYGDDLSLGNPISPLEIIQPFLENGIWYCHGHEYDPMCQYAGWFPGLRERIMHRLLRRTTPGNLKATFLKEQYLMAVYLVYSRASLNLQKRARTEGKDYKGIVLGHTHLPFQHQPPELPLLLDDGDMRHSSTFVVEEEGCFHLMQWKTGQNQWLETSSLRA